MVTSGERRHWSPLKRKPSYVAAYLNLVHSDDRVAGYLCACVCVWILSDLPSCRHSVLRPHWLILINRTPEKSHSGVCYAETFWQSSELPWFGQTTDCHGVMAGTGCACVRVCVHVSVCVGGRVNCGSAECVRTCMGVIVYTSVRAP